MITSSSTFNPSVYKEVKTVIFVHLIVIFLVGLWDIFGLNENFDLEYACIRLAFLLAPLLSIWLYRNDRLRYFYSTWFAVVVFTYSYYYMVNLHYSYYASFLQYFLGLTAIMRFEVVTFIISYSYGFFLFIMASHSDLITDIVDSGHNIKNDMFSTMVPSILFATIFFIQIRKVRKRIEKDEMIFGALGKSTSFLLHELKGAVFRMREDSRLINLTSDIEEVSNIISLSENLKKGRNNNHFIESFTLGEIVSPIIKDLEHYLVPLKVNVSIKDESAEISFDKTILKIILKNLIKNAMEYLAEVKDELKYIRIELFEKNGKTYLQVVNPIHSKLPNPSIFFEPHYSTKSEVTNSGLGLYFSKEILEKNGGRIEAFKNQQELVFQISFIVK